MTNASKILRVGSIIVSLAIAAGCVPKSAQHTGVATPKRNEVQLVRLTHEVVFGGQQGGLSAAEAGKINAFLSSIRYGYGDTVSLDMGNNQMAGVRWNAVNDHLNQSGIWLSDRAPIAGAAPRPGTAVLVVDRYVVQAPQCGDWGQLTSTNWSNAPSPQFGCSTVTLLGLMVANPRDLIQGQTDDHASGAAAADAIRRGLAAQGQGITLGLSLRNIERIGGTR